MQQQKRTGFEYEGMKVALTKKLHLPIEASKNMPRDKMYTKEKIKNTKDRKRIECPNESYILRT